MCIASFNQPTKENQNQNRNQDNQHEKENVNYNGEEEELSSSSRISRHPILLIILSIFIFQIICGIMIPSIDTFLDLGDDVHFYIQRLYGMDSRSMSSRSSSSGSRSSSSSGSSIGYQENLVCLPGAGFSGFWFTLGRLHVSESESVKGNRNSITANTKKSTNDGSSKEQPLHYECFSAGCLSAVATLLQTPLEDVLNIAISSQTLWNEGRLHRYQVVEYFVDHLLGIDDGYDDHAHAHAHAHDANGETNPSLTHDILNRIHVITATRTGMRMDHVTRTPQDIKQLKELLLQTTWIPYVTGKTLWRRDESNNEYHMDGAFAIQSLFFSRSQTRCKQRLGLPSRADLFLYALTPSLEKSKALAFYKNGYDLEKQKQGTVEFVDNPFSM